jgi:hypothetical protein
VFGKEGIRRGPADDSITTARRRADTHRFRQLLDTMSCAIDCAIPHSAEPARIMMI